MNEAAPQLVSRVLPRARHAPGPRYPTALHFLLEARPDPIGFMARAVRQHGDVVRVDAWPLVFHIIANPEHVKYVLQENNRNYWKGETVAKMKVLIGEGLFTSEGDFWRRQRRLAQPAFHRTRIESFATLMTDATSEMLGRWQPLAAEGRPFDVLEEMSRLTLTIVGQSLFGIDLGAEASEVGQAMLTALEALTGRILRPYALPLWVPLPRHRRLARATRELDRVVLGIIERRRREGREIDDLLRMLMAVRDADTGEGMSDRQLRDEVMTFVLAGHETTAVTLGWAFHLLAENPAADERLRTEVAHALGGRVPSLADLPALAYARRVIEETMRLCPAVAVINRQTFAADEIGGYEIPAKSMLFLSPHATHRHPAYWDAPETFDPDRFLPERSSTRPRFAYFPFGGGPRLCIGNEFALMEATLILALVVQRYRLRPAPGHVVTPEVRITLRPKNGVWMTISS